MNKKKTTKKAKSVTKDIAKKGNNIVNTLKKQWKKEKPQRERLKRTTKKAVGNSVKIGSDVFETIRKDVKKLKRGKK